jgi:peptidoglycan/xylan/chitin deacetylase (PgdA/CDA1 family)
MMRALRIVLAVLLVGIVFLYGTLQLSRSRTFQLFGELVDRVETDRPVVALTFDDGPIEALTDSLIRVLDARRVQATFFITGAELAENVEAGARLVAAGHELGNHTYSHQRMVRRSQAFIRNEIESTDSLIRAAGHAGPIHFRPPFGHKLLGLPYYLSRTGRTSITWDIEPDSYPDVAATADGIVSHVLERVRPGSIILLHPWYGSRRTSLEAVPALVDSLLARGYQVTTVDELLQLQEN